MPGLGGWFISPGIDLSPEGKEKHLEMGINLMLVKVHGVFIQFVDQM